MILFSFLSPVLFIVDVQVKFDDFRQAVVATCGAKTVIITNPGEVWVWVWVYTHKHGTHIYMDAQLRYANNTVLICMYVCASMCLHGW